jgi:hypothetical protein
MHVSEICAPQEVQSALLSGSMHNANQHDVWNAVGIYHARRREAVRQSSGTASIGAQSDDLVGTIREVSTFRRGMDSVISRMPIDLQGQVGVAVLELDGVSGLEMFDHPESWLAASKAVARKYGDLLEMESEDGVEARRKDYLKRIEYKALEFYRTMTDQHICSATSMDSEDYTVSVHPRGLTEQIPATRVGGGHQTILALAVRLGEGPLGSNEGT